jgi:hypothetical protein
MHPSIILMCMHACMRCVSQGRALGSPQARARMLKHLRAAEARARHHLGVISVSD